MNSRKIVLSFLLLFGVSIAAVVIFPFLGMELIRPSDLGKDSLQASIFFSLRLPRVLTAFVAGAGLSLCGTVFQGVFRNPLADPFTLGLASGASCGAALVILSGIGGTVLGIPFPALGALSGAAVSLVMVLALSRTLRSRSSHTILLVGIAVSFFFSSLLLLTQYLSSMRDSFQIVRWLMGGVEVFGYGPLLSILPFMGAGLLLIGLNYHSLDHFLTGEDIAQSRGVNVKASRTMLLVAASLVIGGIVSVCGPIGFVGLIVPHICRSLTGASHKTLLPASFLAGGVFLTVCDTFSRIIIAPAEMPVGVLTALLGGPFLLALVAWESRN